MTGKNGLGDAEGGSQITKRTVFGIDLVDSSVYPRREVAVFRDLFSARDCNLDHRHLPHQVGVLFEEQVKRVELPGDALDVVKAVHADDVFHAWIMSCELRDARLDFGLLQTVQDLLRVDPDGEVARSDKVVAEGDTRRGFGQLPTSLLARQRQRGSRDFANVSATYKRSLQVRLKLAL